MTAADYRNLARVARKASLAARKQGRIHGLGLLAVQVALDLLAEALEDAAREASEP